MPTAAFDTLFGDPRFVTTDSRYFATLQYGRQLGAATEAVGRVFVDKLWYRGRYPYESFSGPGTSVQKDEADGGGVGGEFLVTRRLFGRDTATPDALVSLGLRYDHETDIEGSLNPRLGVILAPTRPATFKVLYGKAFRAPRGRRDSG